MLLLIEYYKNFSQLGELNFQYKKVFLKKLTSFNNLTSCNLGKSLANKTFNFG